MRCELLIHTLYCRYLQILLYNLYLSHVFLLSSLSTLFLYSDNAIVLLILWLWLLWWSLSNNIYIHIHRTIVIATMCLRCGLLIHTVYCIYLPIILCKPYLSHVLLLSSLSTLCLYSDNAIVLVIVWLWLVWWLLPSNIYIYIYIYIYIVL